MSNYSYSVVLCTYNGEQYIDALLESIVNQNIAPSEMIVSDDGSSDRTLSIIRRFETNFPSIRFLYLEGPRRGPSENFITSLSNANSEWVFIADQDDIWEKDKVQTYFSVVDSSSRPCLVYSDAMLVDTNGELIACSHLKEIGFSSGYTDNRIYFRNTVQGATILLNRRMLEEVLVCTSKINISQIVMFDWWIAMLSNSFGEIHFIDRPLLLYRVHPKNMIGIRKPSLGKRIGNFIKTVYQITALLKLAEKWNWSSIRNELNLTGSHVRSLGFFRYYMIYISVMGVLVCELIRCKNNSKKF